MGVFVVFKQRHSGSRYPQARRHAGVDLGIGQGIPGHITGEDELCFWIGLGKPYSFQGAGQGYVVLPTAHRHHRIAHMAVAEHHYGLDMGMLAHFEGRIGLLQ
ncbi:hypothetical protein D3C76_1549610 [compost metagenome]